jgi:hypothetical protein
MSDTSIFIGRVNAALTRGVRTPSSPFLNASASRHEVEMALELGWVLTNKTLLHLVLWTLLNTTYR